MKIRSSAILSSLWSFLCGLALVFTTTPASALEPLIPQLRSENSWQKGYLGQLFDLANPNIGFEEIQVSRDPMIPTAVYGGLFTDTAARINTAPEYSEVRFERAGVSYLQTPQSALYRDRCFVYGEDAQNHYNWSGHFSHLSRTARADREVFDKSGRQADEAIFSIAHAPRFGEAALATQFTCTSYVPGEGLRLDVLNNDSGWYTDIEAPVTLTFRKLNGNLIGQFTRDNKVVGYKVCYAKPQVYCAAHVHFWAARHHQDELYPVFWHQVVASENQSSARELLMDSIRRQVDMNECSSYSTPTKSGDIFARKTACAARAKAVASIRCSSDLRKMAWNFPDAEKIKYGPRRQAPNGLVW